MSTTNSDTPKIDLSHDGTKVMFRSVKPDKVVKGADGGGAAEGSRMELKVTPPKGRRKRLCIASLENSLVDSTGEK